ncbi:hypothetical protein CQW23_19599 [Capsicum baccatum]|uniref:Uncharacterized protein n=1 Tax=Capsicum baccatum TaxID=33114 RepID=A0A2G2W689_CAPBA|nr:hypothetical protein CQW23_19599 [Capsicum baccatum]
MRKATQSQCCWEAPISQLDFQELEQLKDSMEALKKYVTNPASKFMVNEIANSSTFFGDNRSGLACDFVVGCYYFTHLGCTSSSFRSSLTSKLVEALVCLQDWLRSESQPISIEEDLDSLEQLEQGYFAVDKDSTSEKVVFNRTVTLRDNYAKGGKSQYSEFLLKSQY